MEDLELRRPLRFDPTTVEGCWEILGTPHVDDRGSFMRLLDSQILEQRGLCGRFVQANLGTNRHEATLRGLHLQRGDDAEIKLIRCLQGSLFDVVVDLRPGSPTYRRWYGTELSADNYRAIYAPAGTAHGYLTLEPETSIMYMVSRPFSPLTEAGLRWDDPSIGVSWPRPPVVISDKDRAWPDYEEARG